MRVAKKRWGEVTIKRQGQRGKNHFDMTKSFSIEEAGHNYSIEEYQSLLGYLTDLTQEYAYKPLLEQLKSLKTSR